MLSFHQIQLTLGGNPVLRGVSLEVRAGETAVLLGRSGSGKTSLLRCANGLVTPDSGEVRVGGEIVRPGPGLIALRRRMGYVIQESGLFPHFTVARNVGVVPRLLGWEEARVAARVEEVLGVVGLPRAEFGERYPHELSGGQRQRAGIARALAADPPVLLMDEPFGALDPITRVELQRQFARLRDALGKTVLFVTHDVREALLLASRVVLLAGGEVDFAGSPAEFRGGPTPEAAAFLEGLG